VCAWGGFEALLRAVQLEGSKREALRLNSFCAHRTTALSNPSASHNSAPSNAQSTPPSSWLLQRATHQVARVLVVGSARERPADLLPHAHGQRVLQVEHRLLPVGHARGGGGGEPHRLVARAKRDVKVGDLLLGVGVGVGRGC